MKRYSGCLVVLLLFIGYVALMVYSSKRNELGEYVYIEETYEDVILHTDKSCCKKARYIKPRDVFNEYYYIDNYCTRCVSDKQFQKMNTILLTQEKVEKRRKQKHQKQP